MAVRALRGATTVDRDDVDEVKKRAGELLEGLLDRNDIQADDLISIFFTTTADISSIAPAAGIRALGYTDVPLLCVGEMPTEGGLARCIRLMVHVETERPRSAMRHLFLRGAVVLRPDLVDDNDDDGDVDPSEGGQPKDTTS
ncbi:MAG: chorismate mutase [Acidimicrobiia bacterium]|nr:chorismate mutase [Acidimicrobiia bacterium]